MGTKPVRMGHKTNETKGRRLDGYGCNFGCEILIIEEGCSDVDYNDSFLEKLQHGSECLDTLSEVGTPIEANSGEGRGAEERLLCRQDIARSCSTDWAAKKGDAKPCNSGET